MAINIFEGSRRIALLLGSGAAVITTVNAFNTSVYHSASYSLAAPNAPFKKTDGACKGEGKKVHFSYETSRDKSIDVSLCLESMVFTNKNKEEAEPIPYKTDADGTMWGKESQSPEVWAYEKQVEKRFALTEAEEDALIKEASKAWRTQFAVAMGYLVAGLSIFGALVWVIGWIVRGFLGIPNGMDKRPDL